MGASPSPHRIKRGQGLTGTANHHLRRLLLGFPSDTPERIARDIRTVQQELPVDLLEFFILTPLPGSADH